MVLDRSGGEFPYFSHMVLLAFRFDVLPTNCLRSFCHHDTLLQITDPRTDYNFLDGSWVDTFNTCDAVAANKVPNPGFAQVNPLVKSGAITLTETYQSKTQHGIFPLSGEQFPLTAHWGEVVPFSLSSSSALRTSVFGPYDDQGNLNDQWVEEAREVVDLGYLQQDTICPRCRAESEFWEMGDGFSYPPGYWIETATEIARDKDMDVKSALQLIFGTTVTGEFIINSTTAMNTLVILFFTNNISKYFLIE